MCCRATPEVLIRTCNVVYYSLINDLYEENALVYPVPLHWSNRCVGYQNLAILGLVDLVSFEEKSCILPGLCRNDQLHKGTIVVSS